MNVEQKGKPLATAEEVSFRQRRKQDALELAQLVYDMFQESQLNDDSDNRSEDIHE
jgi:hypothetical protein